jgi:transcription termination/antitermination protein NusG
MNDALIPKWFIFYCRSRSEKKALERLTDLEFEVYLPIMEEMRQWSDRKKKVQVPMFPGYIFVKCKQHEIQNVITVNHIVAPLKLASQFATLRETEVSLLKEIEKNDLRVTTHEGTINAGDAIQITTGPLTSYKGVCLEELGNHYFMVQLEVLNRYVKVKIHKGWIIGSPKV